MKKSISRLHYITQDIAGFTHPQLVELACIGGANWVQLRVKNKQYDEWLKIALETKSICKKYGARLIINDNIQIAKEISADGVHLGKEDMSPNEARKILEDEDRASDHRGERHEQGPDTDWQRHQSPPRFFAARRAHDWGRPAVHTTAGRRPLVDLILRSLAVRRQLGWP